MKPFRTDGLQKTLYTPQGNFFCLGSLCADFFREVKFVDVLLRDFIADVAPAPDQELSQGHAPAFGIYEYFIVVPATGLSAESTPDE